MIAANIPHVQAIFQMPMKLDPARSNGSGGIEAAELFQTFFIDLELDLLTRCSDQNDEK